MILISHYAKDLGNLKSPEENIQSSLGFFKDLLDLPILENFKNIQLQSQFNNTLSSNAKYLVHEYLNQSYEPFDFVKLKTQGSLQVAQEKSAIEQANTLAIDSTKPLLKKTNTPITLVSPISAKGIYLNNLEMDFLYARMRHIKDPIKWISQKPYIKQTEQELQNALQDFEKDLPRLKKLGVIPKETKK
ncbi:type 11 methyltransferase [Helicobacter pylori]|nr:type 11 methyltransferase [Helicobacter pylori]